jgi:hypothetical protein
MAEALVHWVRDDLAETAAEHGMPLNGIDNYASYDCRGRNRVPGAKLSEHGKGNALDIRGLLVDGGRRVELTDRAVPKPLRERIKASVCSRFKTVLGPGSDGYHENHVHIDLAERRRGASMCQWNVDEAVDVPLPRERPDEAPRQAQPASRPRAGR